MSMPVSGTPPVQSTPQSLPVDNNKLENNEVFQKVASNILNSGQGMLKEAMEKFFAEDEEPDEDDPDAEPL